LYNQVFLKQAFHKGKPPTKHPEQKDLADSGTALSTKHNSSFSNQKYKPKKELNELVFR